MLKIRCSFLFVVVGSLLQFAPTVDAAKKLQEPKAFPVKIIKPSDTTFKHAKIVQPKPEKKRFLWFKKKKAKVTEPKMASVAQTPLNTRLIKPVVEDTKVLPQSTVPMPVRPVEVNRTGENSPAKITPRVESPAEQGKD